MTNQHDFAVGANANHPALRALNTAIEPAQGVFVKDGECRQTNILVDTQQCSESLQVSLDGKVGDDNSKALKG